MRLSYQNKYNKQLKSGTKLSGFRKISFSGFDSFGRVLDELAKFIKNLNSFFF
jgi:hypothetical protein